jgi:hypothetical protein
MYSTKTAHDLRDGVRTHLDAMLSDVRELTDDFGALCSDLRSDLRYLRADLRTDWLNLADKLRTDLEARRDQRRTLSPGHAPGAVPR